MVRTRSLSAETMVGDFKQCDVLISCGEDGGGEEVGGIVGQGKGSGGAEEEIMNQKSEKKALFNMLKLCAQRCTRLHCFSF